MKIDIQARNFFLTDALRSHAERRLRSSLTCCDDYIQQINLRLSDINSPCVNAVRCCHLRVVLAGLFDVVVKDTEDDLYVAIDRATNRAQRMVLRRIERQQILHRRSSACSGRAMKFTQATNQADVRGTFRDFHAADTSV